MLPRKLNQSLLPHSFCDPSKFARMVDDVDPDKTKGKRETSRCITLKSLV